MWVKFHLIAFYEIFSTSIIKKLLYAKIDDGVFDVKISLVKTELTTYCKLFPTTIASNFVINKDR